MNGVVAGLRVIVTAGASGIGRAIVDTLIANGARVVVGDVSRDFLADLRKAHPTVTTVETDVAVEDAVGRLFDAACRALGGLDRLVNNAGIAGPTGGVDEIDPGEWRRCID